MNKRILISILILFLVTSIFAQNKPTTEGVEGYWLVVEKKKPTSIIGVYTYQDKLYAKVLVSFDAKEEGKFYTIEKPSVAEKLQGKPKMQGLDIVWNGKKQINEKKGESRWVDARILDPRGPKLYGAELYRMGDELRLRGYLLSISRLGKSMTWYALKEEDIPAGYTLPSLKGMKPTLLDEFKDK